MRYSNTLVSIGLPVRNGAERIDHVAAAVLNQSHENLELVICDNASTDETEELCRDLAARDSRVVYHRHPINVGLHNNFVSAMALATGEFFRWVGDDDWLDPRCLSRSLEPFAADDRLILVTSQLEYVGPDGVTRSATYDGTALGCDDPVTRFCEMLRLLNEGYLLIDPLYALFRREPVMRIDRRNILREDEVFATKLALAGPWGHVPDVLARRHRKQERPLALARKLDVPRWQAHFANMQQCTEMLRWINHCGLDERQRSRARIAVARMFVRRQRIIVTRRARKLLRVAGHCARRQQPRSPEPTVSAQRPASIGGSCPRSA